MGEFVQDGDGQVRVRLGRPPVYPWDEWADGAPHQVTFDSMAEGGINMLPSRLRQAIITYARNHKLAYRIVRSVVARPGQAGVWDVRLDFQLLPLGTPLAQFAPYLAHESGTRVNKVTKGMLVGASGRVCRMCGGGGSRPHARGCADPDGIEAVTASEIAPAGSVAELTAPLLKRVSVDPGSPPTAGDGMVVRN